MSSIDARYYGFDLENFSTLHFTIFGCRYESFLVYKLVNSHLVKQQLHPRDKRHPVGIERLAKFFSTSVSSRLLLHFLTLWSTSSFLLSTKCIFVSSPKLSHPSIVTSPPLSLQHLLVNLTIHSKRSLWPTVAGSQHKSHPSFHSLVFVSHPIRI